MKTQNDYTRYSDEELQALIDELTPQIRKNSVIAGITGFLGSACGIIGYICVELGLFGRGLGLIFIGLIGIAAASMTGLTASQKKKKLKFAISGSVVRCVLNTRFEVDRYAPTSYIGRLEITEPELIQRSWNRISGSDLIEGRYKGVNFSFSDIHLEMETTDKNGRKTRTTKFKGQWLILSLAKPMTYGVRIRKNGGTSTVQTENIEFNRRFQILASDGHTAFYVLTPQLMEQILKADNRANARMLIGFAGDKMHIALGSNRDLFEMCKEKAKMFKVNNIETLRMQMRWDVNYIANIMDEFLVNEALFNIGVTGSEANAGL